jgi:hypothetical protein
MVENHEYKKASKVYSIPVFINYPFPSVIFNAIDIAPIAQITD